MRALYESLSGAPDLVDAFVMAGGLPLLVGRLKDSTASEEDQEHAAQLAAVAMQPGSISADEVASAVVAAASAALSEASAAQPTTSQPAQLPPNQPCTAGPASLAPQPPTPRMCAAPGCGATRGLRRCSGCHTVRYCGEG